MDKREDIIDKVKMYKRLVLDNFPVPIEQFFSMKLKKQDFN
jgi:hypothetical protein